MDKGKEIQTLRAALVMYLAEQGTPVSNTYEMSTVDLLRDVLMAYLKAEGVNAVVSIHFDNDTR